MRKLMLFRQPIIWEASPPFRYQALRGSGNDDWGGNSSNKLRSLSRVHFPSFRLQFKLSSPNRAPGWMIKDWGSPPLIGQRESDVNKEFENSHCQRFQDALEIVPIEPIDLEINHLTRLRSNV